MHCKFVKRLLGRWNDDFTVSRLYNIFYFIHTYMFQFCNKKKVLILFSWMDFLNALTFKVIIWIVCDWTLRFHMNIPCDMFFLLVLQPFDLDIWPIYFNWHWSNLLKMKYYSFHITHRRSFLMTRSFYWYQNIIFFKIFCIPFFL